VRAAAITALALCAAGPARAETVKPFEVTARIVSGCIVAQDAAGRWGTINLGSVSGVAGDSAQATLLSTAGAGLVIECTPGLSATLSADNGDHPSGGERFLQAAGGTGTIRYRLYANGGSTPWAGGTVPLTFATGAQVIPVRAVATLAGPTAAGIYTDTVRITLSW